MQLILYHILFHSSNDGLHGNGAIHRLNCACMLNVC